MPTFPHSTDTTGPIWSQAWAEAQASAEPDQVTLDTLEFWHPNLSGPIRVVNDTVNLTATLEVDAPRNAGAAVEFIAAPFQVTLPKQDNTSAAPQLEVTVDNIGQELMTVLRQAVQSHESITVIYRPYVSSDLTAPSIDPPIEMVVDDVPSDIYQVRARCSLGDPRARKFPRVEYTPLEFLGLAHG
jgi:hypothetical protein